MAKFLSLYHCIEESYDKNGNFVKEYDTNLPHRKEIIKEFCDQWNKDADAYMLDLVNKECDNRIQSCYMKAYKPKSGKTTLCVEFVAKSGRQLTTKIRNAICDFMDAQYSDGWGEGMFDRITKLPDGTSYRVV